MNNNKNTINKRNTFLINSNKVNKRNTFLINSNNVNNNSNKVNNNSNQVNNNTSVFIVNSVDEFNIILEKAYKYEIIVFVKFGAKWCNPCKQISPFYERLAKENETSIFLSIDVEKLSNISKRYNIKTLPTFIVIKEDICIELMKGGNPNKLKMLVENQLL